MKEGDIKDTAAVQRAAEGCDIIFHCAYDFAGNQEHRRDVSVKGTENIAQAALAAGINRVVHVGTVSVYDMLDGDLDETAPRESSTTDFYKNTKLQAENIMLEYHRKHNLPVSIVQPTLVYGPFSKPWTINVIDQLKSGPVPLPDDSNYCNAVFIDDVIEGMILAAIREQAIGEIILLSAKQPVTWGDFFAAYEKMLGIKSVISVQIKELLAPGTKNRTMQPNQGQSAESISLRQRWSALLKNPEFRLTLIATPIVNWPYLLAKKSPLQRTFLGNIWQQRITEKVLLPNQTKSPVKSAVQSAKPNLSYQKPHPTRLAMYKAKTHVRIDKARRILGYEPAFNLERGMEKTATFVRWYYRD
jgi:nucleoside-diphosphate-sugar epimerase